MRYITNFKETIKKSDIKEAKKLLDQFPGETDETKFELINELALAPDSTASELLFYLALEIKIYDKNIYQHIIQLIMDRAHLNFKFALILYKTGDIKKIKGGVPLMRHILSNSTDQYIIAETIKTAGKEKIEILVDDIAEYIYYDNAELKDRAVKALGSIGSQAAIHRLEQACTTIKCDDTILYTLERLGAGKQFTGQKAITAQRKTMIAEKGQFRNKQYGRRKVAAQQRKLPNNGHETDLDVSPDTLSEKYKKTVMDSEVFHINDSKTHLISDQDKVKKSKILINDEKPAMVSATFHTKKSSIKTHEISKISKDYNTLVSLYEELKSTDIDTRFKALNSIAEMDESDHRHIISKNFTSDNHDLKINTLRFISKTISETFLPDIYALLDTNHMDSKIKFTALETLYAFPALDSAATVIDLIEDPAMYVRIAAAKVLDKNSTDFVCAEIKDRIESGKQRGENIVHALIDAKAVEIIDFLMISDSFSYIAHNYFSEAASDSCLKTFIEILNKRRLKSTAKKFKGMLMEKASAGRPVAAVISSSPCVRDVYEKLLFSKGYTQIGYKSCQDAFEAISSSMPALVLCDLFLNKMTGIDLAKEIREFYPRNELTFIISSNQKDFTQQSLEKECQNAGINAVMEFPARIPEINSK